MSILRTDRWMDKLFDEPSKIFHKFISDSREAAHFYQYLLPFGMYRPNRITYNTYLQLKNEDTWKKVHTVFSHYKEKWNGPDVPVYIFPIHHRSNPSLKGKSGISFHDKMFLFLSPLKDEKELEAILIHEYHHVCRLNNQNKPFEAYTLLDSIMMEGFAEYLVIQSLGEKYAGDWISRYKEKDIQNYWQKYFKKNSHLTRKERLHDVLLFGKGYHPDLIGYAVGYWLVNKYAKKHTFTVRDSFSLTAEKIAKIVDEQDDSFK